MLNVAEEKAKAAKISNLYAYDCAGTLPKDNAESMSLWPRRYDDKDYLAFLFRQAIPWNSLRIERTDGTTTCLEWDENEQLRSEKHYKDGCLFRGRYCRDGVMEEEQPHNPYNVSSIKKFNK